eukprot:COSAG05_NODE_1553_length_4572_cov_80.241672_2_plen_547_part_00
MEPQPETATVRVCGQDIQTTAEELELAGLQVKGPEFFYALSRLVNLRTITLTKMTFADAEWDGSLANIKACRHLTHLNLTACGLGPKHAADLAGIFSSGGYNITTLCLAKNGLTGATFYSSGDVRGCVDSNLVGISTLLAALKTSQVICIDFSGCGLGPGSMDHVAEYLRDAIAAVAHISISRNIITGSTGVAYDLDLSGIIAFGKVAAVSKTLTSIDLSNCGIAAAGIAEVTKFISAEAAVNSLTVDSTGDMQSWNGGPKTYTLTAGDVSIDLSAKNLGPADIALLTAWLQRPEVSAAVKKINLSGCPLTGAKKIGGAWYEIDSDMTGFIALCGVLGKLHEINMSECGLGAASAGEFAKAVSDAEAALAEVVLDGCPLTGATYWNGTLSKNIDSKMDGFVALCAVIGKLKVISLAGCGLGPASMGELGKAVSSADAALARVSVLAHISLAGNKITGSFCRRGDWTYDPDLSGIIALGEAVAVSKTLTSIDFSNCGISAAGIAEVAKMINAGAALAVLNISGAFTPFTSSLLSPIHPFHQFTSFSS